MSKYRILIEDFELEEGQRVEYRPKALSAPEIIFCRKVVSYLKKVRQENKICTVKVGPVIVYYAKMVDEIRYNLTADKPVLLKPYSSLKFVPWHGFILIVRAK